MERFVLPSYFGAKTRSVSSPQVYLNRGYNVDGKAWSTPASVEGIEGIETDASPILYDAVVECRVIKTPREIALMQHINNLSSEAHFEVSGFSPAYVYVSISWVPFWGVVLRV